MKFRRIEKVDLKELMKSLGLTDEKVLEVFRLGLGTLNEWKATGEVPFGLSDELRRIARGDNPSRVLGPTEKPRPSERSVRKWARGVL